MSTALDNLSHNAHTVSPITRSGGRFYWAHYTVEVDEGVACREVARYRTDENGQGIWRWEATGGEWVDGDGHVIGLAHEWKQLVGYTQTAFNCSPGTRRERVLAWLGFGKDDMTAREHYALTDRIRAELL